MSCALVILLPRRSPYGERGLKCHRTVRELDTVRRSPYGERGLKYQGRNEECHRCRVALLTESVD